MWRWPGSCSCPQAWLTPAECRPGSFSDPASIGGAAQSGALSRGQVWLLRGDLAMLPFHGRHFEKIVSIHTFYFWSEPRAIFSQLVSLLVPGGRSVTTFATAHTTPTGERIYWPLHERAETLVSALTQEPGIRASFTRDPDSRQFNNVAVVIDKRYVVALKRCQNAAEQALVTDRLVYRVDSAWMVRQAVGVRAQARYNQ
jgi:hypothetical protein